MKTIAATLKAGMNTLVFGNDNSQAPYIDKVLLKRHGDSSAVGAVGTRAPLSSIAWYSLSGILTPRPTLSGIYVRGNKKYAIKNLPRPSEGGESRASVVNTQR